MAYYLILFLLLSSPAWASYDPPPTAVATATPAFTATPQPAPTLVPTATPAFTATPQPTATPDVPLTYTVGTLPTCNGASKYTRAFVSDSTTCTFATTLTGGGSQACPVFCDGASWLGG